MEVKRKGAGIEHDFPKGSSSIAKGIAKELNGRHSPYKNHRHK